jgi:hypothetical protein
MALLQNAAFVTMFRDAMRSRGRVKDITIDELSDGESAGDTSPDQILAELGSEPMSAARNLFAYLKQPNGDAQPAQAFMDAARVLVFLKGNDAHDYKFSSAVLEDYHHVSPAWRDTYLAANIFMLCNAKERDNQLVERTRAALKV